MTLSESERAAATAFLLEALRYRTFVTMGASTVEVATRVELLAGHLTCLYSQALSLPSVEPDNGDHIPGTRESVLGTGWPGVDARFYREVFDPFPVEADDAPVIGDIDDDVRDILDDVDRGITAWSQGHERDAAWHWRFTFETHWGDHCVDALRALHRLMTASRRA